MSREVSDAIARAHTPGMTKVNNENDAGLEMEKKPRSILSEMTMRYTDRGRKWRGYVTRRACGAHPWMEWRA